VVGGALVSDASARLDVQISVEDPSSPDARWCIEAYFAELDQRFDEGFDPDLSLSTDVSEFAAPYGLLLVARTGGEPVGCGAIKFADGQPPYIKRMWVAPSARGMGVGRLLLARLEAEALLTGARTVRLETNRTLNEAINMYRRAGYTEVEAFNDEHYAHHWFVKHFDD
jgi:GNAT superfamily N-acetyltransferase